MFRNKLPIQRVSVQTTANVHSTSPFPWQHLCTLPSRYSRLKQSERIRGGRTNPKNLTVPTRSGLPAPETTVPPPVEAETAVVDEGNVTRTTSNFPCTNCGLLGFGRMLSATVLGDALALPVTISPGLRDVSFISSAF